MNIFSGYVCVCVCVYFIFVYLLAFATTNEGACSASTALLCLRFLFWPSPQMMMRTLLGRWPGCRRCGVHTDFLGELSLKCRTPAESCLYLLMGN